MVMQSLNTAFVTGGSGFLGLNLLEQLIKLNAQIVVFDLKPSDQAIFKNRSITFIEGDITDPYACEKAMPENIDAVFHLAGNTSHWKYGDDLQTKINVMGTKNIVETALKKKAKRFIHTSSIAAFGFQPDTITEHSNSTAEGSGINYFRTKYLAELEVQQGIQKGLDAVILNPANIIGPYDYSGWSRMFFLIDKGAWLQNGPRIKFSVVDIFSRFLTPPNYLFLCFRTLKPLFAKLNV